MSPSNPGTAKSPIRLLYLITTLGRGGSERNLVQYCEQIDRERFVPEVWYLHETKDDYSDRLKAAGVSVCCLNVPAGFNPWNLISTARKLANSNADLIHVFLPTVGYPAVLGKFLFRSKIPMIYSCGGVQLLLPFQRQMMRYGLGRYCNPILCNSQTVWQFLCGIGIAENRLRIVPNGHDLDRYSRPLDLALVRQSLGIPDTAEVILTVGRLVGSKRHEDLIRAFATINESRPNLMLVIVGEGEQEQLLRQLVDELKCSSQVRFTGFQEDVISIMRASDIFAFPSESEGLPNSVIEACLAQLPIVATDIGPVAGIVEHDQSALLVPPRSPDMMAKALLKMLDDPHMAREFAKTAGESARKRFGLQATMEKLYAAYDEALGRSKKF